MKVLEILFWFLCISQILSHDEAEIQKTFDLLEEGDRKLDLTKKTEAVLVFGTTGCGKSTLVQWIAGDNSNLIAKETFPGSEEYIIRDTNDKIGSSTLSKTLFPELVIDEAKGTSFYDFPGFRDTRSSSHDIAASFFMKTVIGHVEKVKMLFLTSYHTVKEGVDRSGFTSLLKNIDDMIKDVDKFENSIALVVTKVDAYTRQGRLKPDSTVIKGIVEYLQKVREVYEDKLKNLDVSDKKRKFSANAIKIINIFLTQEDGEYTRITLFRRPEEESLLSESELLLEGKLIVQHVIADNLRFSQTDPDDFGFTISDNSKLEIDNLVNVINEQITGKVDGLVTDIRTKLESFVEPVRVQIDSDNIEALNLKQSHEFSMQSDLSQTVLSEAVNFFTHVNGIHGIGEKLNKYLTTLKVAVPTSLEENMTKFSKYFDFFQLFNEIPLKTSSLSWTKSFQSALTYLTESKQFIRDKASIMAEEINSQITINVDAIISDFKANLTAEVNRMTKKVQSLVDNSTKVEVDALDARAFHKNLVMAEEILTSLTENIQNLSKTKKLALKAPKNLAVVSDLVSTIIVKSERFEILQIVGGFNFGLSSDQWSKSIKTVVTYIQTQNILTHALHAKQSIKTHDSLLRKITDDVQSIVGRKTLEMDLKEVGTELNKWFLSFSSIVRVFGPESTLKKLSDDIGSSLLDLNSYEMKMRDISTSLNEQEKHLAFLAALEGGKTNIQVNSEWKNRIFELVEFLRAEVDFNDFAMELFENFSQFKVQNDTEKYDFPILNENNFKHFLYKIKALNTKAEANILQIIPTASRISILNNVINFTIKNRIVAECPWKKNSTVVLQANFIKFSEFLDQNGKYKGCGWENIAALELHALNTIFIDQDLNALDYRLELKIIAHKWEVIGKRKIILDGKNGEIQEKAADGIFPSGHGQNGAPGLPGGSAGAFFGVVGTFINSENLTISANGGNGGPGQSGGNGANGQDGKTPFDPPPPYYSSTSEHHFEPSWYEKKGFVFEDVTSCFWGICFDDRDRKIHGTRATSGGNSGSCGLGGRGGFSGKISVNTFSGQSNEVKIAIDGVDGANGVLGQTGIGGQHGNNIYVSTRPARWKKPSNHVLGPFGDWLETIGGFRIETTGSAPNGLPSLNCSNINQKSPLEAVKILNAGGFLRNSMELFIESSTERLAKFSTLKFYEKINENAQIRKLRNTFELVEDLKMLENCPRDKKLNLLPFYEIHLANIESYKLNPNENDKSKNFEKVLTYLYSTSLSQMTNLRENEDFDLIIDINQHLEIVKKNILEMKSLQDESRLVSVVTTLKDQFKKQVNLKIDEAQSLIENVITPEMVSVSSNFRVQIHNLVVEIDDLQHAATEETGKLERKIEEAKQAMVASSVLGAMSVISQFTSFFGGAGQAVSVGMDLATSVGSMLSQDEAPTMSAFLTEEQATRVTRLQKLQNLGNSVISLSNRIKSDQNAITEITEKIDAMKEVSEKLKESQERVFKILIPLIEDMNKFLSVTAMSLASKSGVSLDVIGWQVQAKLRSIFDEIQEMTRKFDCGKAVTTLVERLGEAMKILIRVYDRIQDYQEQQRLATYLADLSSASAQKIVISDPKLDNSLRELQISIRSNILLNQYNSVLNAFKQWVFPFADFFLKDTTTTRSMYGTFFDVESLASKASSKIEAIQTQIKTYSSTITRIDQHIHTESFNQSSDFSNSFYVWKKEEHRDMITKLLAGETILAKADIRESSAVKDAIKFNFIELGFQSDNNSIQAEINKNLLNFGINMTHLGNSNYRYKNQYFTIVSPSQPMHYSFQKDRHGVASSSNNVYKKLCSGDILLSPYALWELKLTLGEKKKSFDSLSKFWNQVDLVLEGSGTYLSEGTQFDVASFYKVDDSV